MDFLFLPELAQWYKLRPEFGGQKTPREGCAMETDFPSLVEQGPQPVWQDRRRITMESNYTQGGTDFEEGELEASSEERDKDLEIDADLPPKSHIRHIGVDPGFGGFKVSELYGGDSIRVEITPAVVGVGQKEMGLLSLPTLDCAARHAYANDR